MAANEPFMMIAQGTCDSAILEYPLLQLSSVCRLLEHDPVNDRGQCYIFAEDVEHNINMQVETIWARVFRRVDYVSLIDF